MTHFLHTEADLQAGLAQLILADPRLEPVAEKAGAFSLRRREAGFAGLCAIVCGQQLSTASRRHDSRPAVRRLRSVPSRHGAPRAHRQAQAARPVGAEDQIDPRDRQSGRQGPDRSHRRRQHGRRRAHAALTALHGIGPWSADIYLLFCLGHSDAFPAGDLAVQEAARIAFGLRKRPDPKALTKMAEAWRPWRGVAAHLLWAYYHVVKRREGISLPAGQPDEKTGKDEEISEKEKAEWLNSTAQSGH